MRKSLILLSVLFSVESTAQIVFGRNENNHSGFSVNYSSPKEYEIADIEVKGVQFLDNNALISLSGLRVGDKIKVPGDEISQALKKLWKQGIISDLSIAASKVEGNKIWLILEMSERPRLTRYEIEGVNHAQKAEIEEKIELTRGKVLTDVLIKNAELTVTRLLNSKGYLNAKVRVVQQSDTVLRNSSYIKIMVNRGQKVKIRNIRFEGNEHFSSAQLRKKFTKTGMIPKFSLLTDLLGKTVHLMWPPNLINFIKTSKTVDKENFREYLATHVNLNFFKNSKFVKSDYHEDKKTLIAFYNSKGYRDAEITADTAYNISNKHMNIDIIINIGEKYYFRNIDWTGNYIYSDEQLERILGIKKGDVYDLELVSKKLHLNPNGVDVSSLYLDDGYLFFNINPVEVGIYEDSIDLEMRIFEGAQATINKIIISGNNKTNDHVILRELRTLPGDKFSRAQLIRTQRELSQLGYFDPEQVNPLPIPDPINETVDVEWQLTERSNDQIELSGGWGGAFGFVGTLGVTFNNFSVRNIMRPTKWRALPVGDGQRLSVRFQANGRNFQSHSFSFVEPWLGGRKPNSFGISYSKSIQRSVDRVLDKTVGFLKVTGVSVSLGRRIQWPDDFFTVSNSISYQRYNLFQFTSRSLGFSTGESNSFTFNTTISRNSVDNPMFPRKGSSVSLSMTLTPPYSLWRDINYETADRQTKFKWLEYHKWNFDTKHYLTLTGKLVLAARVHFGYLDVYDKSVGVAPFERFQLGGDGLTGQNFLLGTDVIGLRGYPNNSLVPKDPANNIEGGTIFNKYVMELRYPVSLSPVATIYALTFLEGGNNWDNFADYNPYNIKKSAGVGLRIFMPAFGLLGLDWAYGFDRIPETLDVSGAQFHFSLGQQIR